MAVCTARDGKTAAYEERATETRNHDVVTSWLVWTEEAVVPWNNWWSGPRRLPTHRAHRECYHGQYKPAQTITEIT